MANLKEIRNRITSVNSTMQITSAMKMVSAAKLKRAQDAITQMRPYAEKLQEILSNVSSTLDSSEGVYSQQRELKKVLFVAVTANRGLCGGFNNNVVKKINGLSAQAKYANAEISILPIGKKGKDAFKNSGKLYNGSLIDGDLEGIWDELNFANVSNIADQIMSTYVAGDFDEVVVFYNKFKNAAVQELMAEPFLPLLPVEEEESTSSVDYIFEPNKETIVEDLIPKSLKVQLYKALLDSRASEHGARMTAMHTATDNASELKNDLTRHYNKVRQAAITNEILEIVGGAEALNN